MPPFWELSRAFGHLQVITVPAHFNERQRAATVQAGMLGGLKRVRLLQGMPKNPPLQHCAFPVRDLISHTAASAGVIKPIRLGHRLDISGWSAEPVAAVIAYGLGRETEDSLVLVVDLGGGTYDVSLVECFEGKDTQQVKG